MKKILTLTLFFLGMQSINANAQKNLQPGYIILNNNDTITGFIDYREWYQNPATISFQPSKEAHSKPVSIRDIRYFEVINRESYERQVVNISLDTQLFSDLSDKDTSTKTDTVFLKVVHDGKNISLFSYKDEVKLRWFVKQTNESTPRELLNSVYRVEGSVVNERQYRNQLFKIAAVYLPGDQEIQTAIKHADYGKKSLLDICYRINGLDNNEIKKQYKNRELPFRFFAGVGVNRGSINFSGDNHFSGSNSLASYMPVLGGGVDLYFIPAIGKLFLRSSLTVSSLKSEMTSATEYYYKATEIFYFRMTQVNITFHSQLNYNLYNKPGFKWFIGAGAGFNISFYPKNQQTFVREGLNASTSVNDNYMEFMRKFWLNASLRSGVAIKNLEIAINYFPKSSISDYVSFSVDNSSLQLQINYLFIGKEIVHK